MPQFTTTRRVKHAAADMFDLVADVERYPEFVPLCRAMRGMRRTKTGAREVVRALKSGAQTRLHPPLRFGLRAPGRPRVRQGGHGVNCDARFAIPGGRDEIAPEVPRFEP